MKLPEISSLPTKNISKVAEMAKVIWHQHYDPIIGKQQVDYMLSKFQSTQAIADQIEQGYQYFQVIDNEEIVGYFSIQLRDAIDLFISKFYLLEITRGKGFGRAMLIYIEQLALEKGCHNLKLTVNKYNPAYQIYLKLGFIKDGSAEFDIGGGYIMDDHLLTKKIQ